MKAITISQPYASYIVDGEPLGDTKVLKIVENRRRFFGYRGQIVIHAGKGTQYLSPQQLRQYPSGCAVGLADLVACFDRVVIRQQARTAADLPIFVDAPYTWGQLDEHRHTEGPFCLILANVTRLERNIPMKGQLGIFDVPADVAKLIRPAR